MLSGRQDENPVIKMPSETILGFQTAFLYLKPCNAQHAFYIAEAGEDAREVVDLFDFEREPHTGFQITRLGLHGGNVEFVAGERVGYVAQKPRAVLGADFDIDGEHLSFLQRRPTCVQHFFGRVFGKVSERGAGVAVDGNAAVACNEADNIVRRCRFAAFGKRGHQTVFAVDQNTVFAAFFDFGLFDDSGFADGYGRRFVQRAAGFLDGAVGNFALSDGGIEVVEFFEAEVFGKLLQVGLGREFGKLLVDLDAAFFAHGVGILLADVGADFTDCLAGFDPAFVEPVDGRMPFFGGNDFDALSVFKLGGQRHDLPFDFRAAATVANAAVQGVGEVDGGRARGQGEDFAVRGQNINRVVEQLGFEGGGKVFLAAFRHIFAPVQELAQPGDFLLVGGIALAAFFVTPVRGDTEFVELVHIEGADLHFHAFVFRTDDDGVQTFIAVAFGVGDIVVELARNRLPEAVDNAQRGITLGNGVHQNP